MSKSQQIRDALAGGELPFDALHEKIGGDAKKLRDLCSFLQTRGEIHLKGRGDNLRVALIRKHGARKGRPPPEARRACYPPPSRA